MCNKKWKQKLSIAMAAVLVAGAAMPVTAFAAEESVNIQQEIAPQKEALPAEEAAVEVMEEEPLVGDVTSETLVISADTPHIEARKYENNPNIVKVVIQEGVESIGESAFKNCSRLAVVELPKSLKTIETGAFSYCHNLGSIAIPSSVSVISQRAFYYCENLKTVDIPEGVTEIGVEAFALCQKLAKVTLPNSIQKIGEQAFLSCEGLESINIPEGVTEIMPETFANCRALSSVSLPGSLRSIGNRAFEYCNKLKRIDFKNNLEEIGDGAFNRCGLESVSLPKSVVRIGTIGFYSCAELQKVSIPSDASLKEIGASAFKLCGKLKDIVLPESLESVGSDAFVVTGLESMFIPGKVSTISNYMFSECQNLKSVVIREGAMSINGGAFLSCGSLLYVVIPSSVILIEDNAFPKSDKLVLFGVKGTRAEEYAAEKEIPFQEYSQTQEQALIACAEDFTALTVPEETDKNLALPATGAKGSAIQWESDNSQALSIEGAQAVAHRGKEDARANLTATVTNSGIKFTKSFPVRVKNDWAGWAVKEDAEALSLPGTATEKLDLPGYGTVNYCGIRWTSSHPKVISEYGEVTRGAQDVTVTLTAEITVDYAKTTKTFKVTVPKDPSIADADAAAKAKAKAEAAKALKAVQAPAAKTLYTGSVSHTATIALTYPKDFTAKLKAAGLSRKSVTYRSDKPAVASVTPQGKVTGLKAGKATITTTVTLSDGQKKTLKTAVTVKKPYLKISGKTSVKRGKTLTLKANRYGIAKSAACTWSVDKAKLATISKKTGKLGAKKAGTVTVTVKAGTVKASYKVKIKK